MKKLALTRTVDGWKCRIETIRNSEGIYWHYIIGYKDIPEYEFDFGKFSSLKDAQRKLHTLTPNDSSRRYHRRKDDDNKCLEDL